MGVSQILSMYITGLINIAFNIIFMKTNDMLKLINLKIWNHTNKNKVRRIEIVTKPNELVSISLKTWWSFLLARRPITLVLMMINSYSYNTNDLVFIKFQIFNQHLSRCLTSIKDSKSTFETSKCWFKSSRFKIASSTERGV